MTPCDKYGWPVEFVIGRPVLNFFRLLILTDIGMTWKWGRNAKWESGGNVLQDVGSSK